MKPILIITPLTRYLSLGGKTNKQIKNSGSKMIAWFSVSLGNRFDFQGLCYLICERLSYHYPVSKFPSSLKYYDSKWTIGKIKKLYPIKGL